MREDCKDSSMEIEEELCARFEKAVLAGVSSDRHLVWRGRNLSVDCLVQIGTVPFLLRIEVDADSRGKLDGINAAVCPLYLLTGEYDFSCQPEDTLRTASTIPGVKVTIMKEVGHFPMSENPAEFRKYLLPILEEIRQQKS